MLSPFGKIVWLCIIVIRVLTSIHKQYVYRNIVQIINIYHVILFDKDNIDNIG